MPDATAPGPGDPKQYKINVSFGSDNSGEQLQRSLEAVVQAADDAAKAFKFASGSFHSLGDEARRTTSEVGKSTGSFRTFGSVIQTAGAKTTGLVSSLGALFGIATTLSFEHIVKELYEYNKAMVAARPYFLKYGEGLDQIEARFNRIGESMGLARQQVIDLAKAYTRGFTYAPLKDFDSFLKGMARSVGNNAEALADLQQQIIAISKVSPTLGVTLRQGFGAGGAAGAKGAASSQAQAIAMLATGKISSEQFTGIIDPLIAATHKGTAGDAKTNSDMRSAIDAVQNIHRIMENIRIDMAQTIMPSLIMISDTLRDHKDILMILSKTVKLIGMALGVAGSISTGRWMLGQAAKVMGYQSAGNMASKILGIGGSAGAGGLGVGGIASGGAAGAIASVAAIAATAVIASIGGHLIGEYFALAGIDMGKIKNTIEDQGNFHKKITGEHTFSSDPVMNKIISDRAKEQADLDEQVSKKRGELTGGYGNNLAGGTRVIAGAVVKGLAWMMGKKNFSVLSYDQPVEARLMGTDEYKKAQRFRQTSQNFANTMKIQAANTLSEQQAEKALAEEKQRSLEKQFGINVLTEEGEAKLLKIHQVQESINERLEIQKQILAASNIIYQTRFKLLQQSGGSDKAGFDEAAAEQNREIQNTITATTNAITLLGQMTDITEKLTGKGLSDPKATEKLVDLARQIAAGKNDKDFDALSKVQMNAFGIENARLMVQSKMKQYQTEILGLLVQQNDIAMQQTHRFDESRKSQGLQVQQSQQLIQIYQNFGIGVGQTAAMMRDVVDQLDREIKIIDMSVAATNDEISKAQQNLAIAQESGSDDAIKTANANILQLQIRQKEQVNERLGLVLQEVQATKSLRDGYLSALAALNTGRGAFTKIIVDQQQMIGTFLRSASGAVQSMGTGQSALSGTNTRVGFGGSESFSPYGGISNARRLSLSPGSAAMINATNPAGFLPVSGNSQLIQYSNYLRKRALSDRQGAAAITNTVGGNSAFGNSTSSPTTAAGILQQATGQGPGVTIQLSDRQLKDLREALTNEFADSMKGVMKAAMNKVFNEMLSR